MSRLSSNLRLPILVLALCFAAAGGAFGGERSKPPCRHTVRRGDTLAKIARRYYGSKDGWKRIKRANRGLNERNLKIGQRIFIPAKEGPARPPQPDPQPAPPAPQPPPAGGADGPDSKTPPLGELAFLLIYWAVSIPAHVAYESFLLWIAVKFLRRRLYIKKDSFGRALRGTILCSLVGFLFAAVIMGALLGVTGLAAAEYHVGSIVLLVVALLLIVGAIWANCAILGRNYGVTTREGLTVLIAWSLAGVAISLLLGLAALIVIGIVVGIIAILT